MPRIDYGAATGETTQAEGRRSLWGSEHLGQWEHGPQWPSFSDEKGDHPGDWDRSVKWIQGFIFPFSSC